MERGIKVIGDVNFSNDNGLYTINKRELTDEQTELLMTILYFEWGVRFDSLNGNWTREVAD